MRIKLATVKWSDSELMTWMTITIFLSISYGLPYLEYICTSYPPLLSYLYFFTMVCIFELFYSDSTLAGSSLSCLPPVTPFYSAS